MRVMGLAVLAAPYSEADFKWIQKTGQSDFDDGVSA